MIVYIFILIFVMVFGIICKGNKKLYNVVTPFLLASVSGLRDFTVGHDTRGYIRSFESVGICDFRTLIVNTPYDFEKGYAVYSWLTYKLMPNGHFFLFVSMLICFMLIGRWFEKNAAYLVESYLIFICVYFTFFLTGLRQSLAIAILSLSFEYIKERKPIKFLLVVLFASLFHKTALIFLIAYPMFTTKAINVKMIITIVLIPVIYLNREVIFLWLAPLAGYEQYQLLSHGDPMTYSVFIYSITIACTLLRKKIINNNPEFNYYVNSLLLACLFMPFVGLNGAMLRLVMYFSIYLVFAAPELAYVFKDMQIRFIVISVMIGVLIYLFFRNIMASDVYQYKMFF